MTSAHGSPCPLGIPIPPPVLLVLPSEETITTRSVTVVIDEVGVRDVGEGAARRDHQRPVRETQALGDLDDASARRSIGSAVVSSMLPLAGITSGGPMLEIGSGRFLSPLERAAVDQVR